MEDDNRELTELPPTDVVDQDMEILEIGGAKNLMFTICLKPGTSMQIKIESEEILPAGNCRISTLLTHNGCNYTSTIPNYAMNPDFLRSLGQIHVPHVDNTNGMLPQLLMPLALPRCQPIDVNDIFDSIRHYMLDMARQIDYLTQPIEGSNGMSTLMINTPHTQEALVTMLDNFERTLRYYHTLQETNETNEETDDYYEKMETDEAIEAYDVDFVMNDESDAYYDADDSEMVMIAVGPPSRTFHNLKFNTE